MNAWSILLSPRFAAALDTLGEEARRHAWLQNRPEDPPQNDEASRQVHACTAPLKPHGQGAERSESGSDATHYFTFFDQI